MKRDSPCRHHVSGYTRRDGTKVNHYYRGSGKKKPHRRGDTVDLDLVNKINKDDDGGGNEWEHYTITLIYDNDAVETIPIMAYDADDALNAALDIRRYPKRKVKTSIVQDGIGDVVRKLAKGVNRRLTQGRIAYETGRGIIKSAKRAPERFKKQLINQAEQGEIEALVKRGQDTKNKRKARAARRLLKRKYPVVYKSIGWTRV